VKKKKDVTPSPTPSRETSRIPVPMDTDAVVEKAANDPKKAQRSHFAVYFHEGLNTWYCKKVH